MVTPSDPRRAADAGPARGARVVVTGAAGTLGSVLLERLAAPGVGVEVVAVDRRSGSGPTGERLRLDVLRDDLGAAFAGATTVVHLAASPDCSPDDPVGRAAVEGTRRVLAAAAAAGVARIVRPSATAVYGAWANNPEVIGEDAPLRPNPGFGPAGADAECERLLAAWARDRVGRIADRLRLAPVLGGARHSALANAALGRVPVHVRGAAPVVQVLHVDDAASALAAAALGALPDLVNVAAPGVVAPVRSGGARVAGCSVAAATRALDACWSSGRFGASGAVVPYLVHPFVVDTTRLAAAGVAPAVAAGAAVAAAGDQPVRLGDAARAAAAVLGAERGRLRRRSRAGAPSRPIGA
ncbi:MAG: NAD-dependent epimerase/dehydratase family protein [Actinomycetota bacterium]